MKQIEKYIDIDKFLKKSGLTRQEAADKLGVTYQTLVNWKAGKIPDFAHVIQQMKLLSGMETDELIRVKR